MPERILVTGGTGKTGRRVVERLRAKGLMPRIATRSPGDASSVQFRWQDPSTFDGAFRGIEAVYLVAPTDTFDSIGAMQPGLEAARRAGVSRFVLLSASSLEEGGPMMGAIHTWLRANVPEWTVLRPSWFMQNFSEGQHLASIRDDSTIFTAAQDGRIGFIDAQDIASCAATLLTSPEIENTDHIITGPQAISYASVAKAFSLHLGRGIDHKRLTTVGIVEHFVKSGLPDDYARTLAAMDAAIAAGSEDRTTDTVRKITGHAPANFDEFVRRNSTIWTT